jgi:hypothetical protein
MFTGLFFFGVPKDPSAKVLEVKIRELCRYISWKGLCASRIGGMDPTTLSVDLTVVSTSIRTLLFSCWDKTKAPF